MLYARAAGYYWNQTIEVKLELSSMLKVCEQLIYLLIGNFMRIFCFEAFHGNEKFAAIIQRIAEQGKVSSSIAWLIKSWDKLSSSENLKAEACKLCPK